MTVQELKTELELKTSYRWAHFAWSHAPEESYGVISEDLAVARWSDNHKQVERLQLTVDLFVLDDTGAGKAAVEAVFDSMGIGYSLDDIMYEDETGYLHYIWEVSIT